MSPSKHKGRIPQVYGSLTDVGNVRSHNEDSFAAVSPLFVVADGMGGHEAGEVASAISIETMLERVPSHADGEQLAAAIKAANIAVLRASQDGTGKPGMGTTMTAALIYDDELVIGQVGDSRAYLLSNGTLQRITRDHSLVADLIDQGRITEEEARFHPQRSVITRALGSDADMEPDIYRLNVRKGDRLLLCSDGLTGMVEDSDIEELLGSYDDPQECCTALVNEALAGGGLDNVTVVVVDPLREASAGGSAGSANAGARGTKRKRRIAPFLWALAFVAILAAAAGGFYAYAQNTYYLIAEDGYVCIYRGLPGQFMGLKASWLVEKTDVAVDKLAPQLADRLEGGMSVSNLDAAYGNIADYRDATGAEGA